MADDAATAAEDDTAEDSAPVVEMLHGVPVSRSRDQLVLHPDRDGLLELVTVLKSEGFVTLIDCCGVDYLHHSTARALPDGVEPERFEVSYVLRNHREYSMIRLRVQVPVGDPTVPSLFGLYVGTEALERETYDMFGIVFSDHPDMTRILMPEHWEGHPLRKDYAIGRIPVQFKEADL